MTNAVVAALEQAASDLESVGAQWALVGGFAVSARAEPRFTRDVDVCVVVDSDDDADRLSGALIARGYAVESLVEHAYLDRLATVRLRSPVGGGVVVDLLFASSGIEREIVEGAEPLEILPGLTVPVARSAHLVVLKLLARDDATRPQDAVDLVALHATLTDDDRAEVRRAAGLVAARGFHRERDLVSLADSYLSS